MKQKITLGFTLIELIIVVAVIGVLFTVFISTINPPEQFKKSRDTKRKTTMAQIQKALEAYYQDHGRYPASSPTYKIVSIVNGTTSTLNWGEPWLPYMDVLPEDPTTGQSYAYYTNDATGQTYYLYASLERGENDPNVCNDGAKCTTLPNVNPSPCGGVCNFGVSSPNVRP